MDTLPKDHDLGDSPQSLGIARLADLRALLAVATDEDIDVVRESTELIEARSINSLIEQSMKP